MLSIQYSRSMSCTVQYTLTALHDGMCYILGSCQLSLTMHLLQYSHRARCLCIATIHRADIDSIR